MTAADRAADLAERFGLKKRIRSWGGDCPACSYHNAFSIKVSRKTGRPAMFCANGCDKSQLNAEAERVMGTAWTPTPAPADADVNAARQRKRQAAEKMWNGAGQCLNTPAHVYLESRHLDPFACCPSLRYRADVWHPDGNRHPAMIAKVSDTAGALIAIHRVFLTRAGRKADLDPPKASLGPVWSGAVHLDPPDTELVVGEGIETAGAAGLLLNLPAWAAVSAGNIAAGLILPATVRRVAIAADADVPGQRAADDAARRWTAEGRQVRVLTPDVPGQDFADILVSRMAEGASP